MKRLTLVLTLLVASSAATASPELIWEWQDVGDGLRGYTVSISDVQFASWAVNLDFWGCCGPPIRQMTSFFGFDVNFQPGIIIDPDPSPDSYRADQDSWVYGEACEYWNPLATGVQGRPGEPFHIHVGTPAGEVFGTIPLAYLVIEEDGCICWDGVIARQGLDYATSGQIPEPAAGLLLAAGAAALRRRRHREL